MNNEFSRNDQIEAAPLNEEAILFNPVSTNFFMLNQTSSFIWDNLPTARTVEALADRICAHFAQVTREVALRDVQIALDQMLQKQIVVIG